MKYIKTILIALAVLVPIHAFAAFPVGWNATSTAAGKIYPSKVGGVNPSILADFFNATSTTATSIFNGFVSSPKWSDMNMLYSNAGVLTGTNKIQITGGGNVVEITGNTTFGAGVDFQGNTVSNIGTMGSGWLHQTSSGTVLASTSPTVNWITATSTTATSTFAGGVQANLLQVTSTTASSSFANGINLTKGCFAVNGTCVTGGGSGVSGGTTGMLTSWTSATTLTATGTPTAAAYVATSTTATSTFAGGITGPNSFTIQSTTGNLGIGLASPLASLHVRAPSIGSGVTRAGIILDASYLSATSVNTLDFSLSAAANMASRIGNISPDGFGGNLVFQTNPNVTTGSALERMRINSAGNVGIGTTSPYAKLSVVGEVVASNFTATTTGINSFRGMTLIGTSTTPTGLTSTLIVSDSTSSAAGSARGIGVVNTASINPTYESRFYTANDAANGSVAATYLSSSVAGQNSRLFLGNSTNGFYALNLGNVFTIESMPSFTLTKGQYIAWGDSNNSITVQDTPAWLAQNNVLTSSQYDDVNGGSWVWRGSNSGLTFMTLSGRDANEGNLGIGTSTPYAKLSVVANHANGYQPTVFTIASSTPTATTTLVSVLANGNVGIGTTSPYAKLSVVGQVAAEYFTATSTTATSTFNGAVSITRDRATGGTRNSRQYINGPECVYTSQFCGQLQIAANGANTSVNHPNSGLYFGIDATTLTTGGSPFIQSWNTFTGISSLYGSLSLNPNGGGVTVNGIGFPVSAVTELGLTVVGNAANDAYVLVNSVQNDGNAGILFRGYNSFVGDNAYTKAGVIFNNRETCSNFCRGDLRFLLNSTASGASVNDNVTADTAMIITYESKNVGIGTSTPYAKLSVVGEGVFRNLTATSTTATTTIAGPLKLGSTGTSPTVGNATLVAGTVTVTTGAATSNSFVMLTRKTTGGTIGTAITYTITNGSFTITSDNPLDTSVFTWVVIN